MEQTPGQELSKSKRKRIRKKQNKQGPKEDGGEAQVEIELVKGIVVPKAELLLPEPCSCLKPETKKEEPLIDVEKDVAPAPKPVLINPEKASESRGKLEEQLISQDIPKSEKVKMEAAKAAEMSREEIIAARKAKKDAKKSKENKKPEVKKDDKEKTPAPPKEKAPAPPKEKAPAVKEKAQLPVKEPASAPPKAQESTVEKTEAKKEDSSNKEKTEAQQKSSKELKEERRLKQEAQRAAKAQKSDQSKVQKTEAPIKSAAKPAGQIVVKPAKTLLHGLARTVAAMKKESNAAGAGELSEIHPAFLQLGAQLRSRLVDGCTAQGIALMRALRSLINDYQVPENVEIHRHLAQQVQQQMAYLDTCRPNSVSMEQAVRSLRINALPYGTTEQEAKATLNQAINNYINKIAQDSQSVALNLADKMVPGDLILVYSYSCLLVNVLTELLKNTNFRVVVIGSKSHNGGLRMLQKLSEIGIECTYLLLNQVNFILPKVQLVLLGADSMSANCSMIGAAGSAQLAIVAKSQGVPVYACCETSKFSYQSHLSPFYKQNEIEPDCVAPQLKKLPNLTQCSLLYDVVPERLITAILTEVSILPCSSVPVVLHMQSSDTVLKTRTT